MRFLRSLTIILLIAGLLGAGAALAQKRKKSIRNPHAAKKTKKNVQPPLTETTEDFQFLSSGLMGSAEEPFIFVARDTEAFETLTKIVPELSETPSIDFSKYAVVAAFLGTKPTAGYAVELRKSASGGVKIQTVGRPEGAMVAQVLTMPFKVSLVPIARDQMLSIEVGEDWTNAAQVFRITSGDFSFSGGFKPIQKSFQLEGIVRLWRWQDLVTLDFNLSGKANEKGRRLDEIASGSLDGNNLILSRIDAGNLVDNPHPPLKATGSLNENILSLSFESLSTTFSDGYEGKGSLTAEK